VDLLDIDYLQMVAEVHEGVGPGEIEVREEAS
jgi:hypothetical protein